MHENVFPRPLPKYSEEEARMYNLYREKIFDRVVKPNIKENDSNGLRMLRAWQIMDNPERMLNKSYVSNLRYLPLHGNTTVFPWSGHYWPHRYGKLAVRYTGDLYDTQYDYSVHGVRYVPTYPYPVSINKYHQPAEHNYYSTKPDYEKFVNDVYSSAEKYDLLVGDYNFTLTNQMKEDGKAIQMRNGDIPGWQGICHGWSIASFMEKRPLKPVYLRAADKKTVIKFLPDDIKGLASQYWADLKFDNHMVGYRCTNYWNQQSDQNTGLTLTYECFALNPASFHLVMTNYIGIRRKNVVFEPKVDSEIWNHPVNGYHSFYYHPLTNRTGTLDESLMTVGQAELYNNPFLKFVLRNKTESAKYIIGVNTTVYYVSENAPSRKKFDQPDSKKEVSYTYILVLDGNLKILEGEWSINKHVNYIYTASEDFSSDIDKKYPVWLGSPEYLDQIRESIKEQSRNKIPLKAIVRLLVQRSVDPSNTNN
jgi:hypothetical protein